MREDKIITPFGELNIVLDGNRIPYTYTVRTKSEPCKDVDGRYLIEVVFTPDGEEHTIACVFDKVDTMKYSQFIESGEFLECNAFYMDKVKLSIGASVDSEALDFEAEYVDNGITFLIFPHTKNTRYMFGISWINNCTYMNDVQTWFGADPLYP